MWIKVTDLESNRILLDTDKIIGVVIPSPLARGDGRCQILTPAMIFVVSPAEARRVQDEVTRSLSLVEVGIDKES